ncbi:MAG: hypothetical protein AAGJ94_12600 [Pseudomonadota bacterium]
MTIRLKSSLLAFCLGLAAAAMLSAQRAPVTQVDIYATNAVAPFIAGVTDLAGSRSKEALRVRGEGSSTMSTRPFTDPMSASADALQIDVSAVGPKRVRIRVSGADHVTSLNAALQLRQLLLDKGLQERLSLTSESSGDRTALLARAFAVLFGVFAVALLAMRLAPSATPISRLPWVNGGAAST